MLNVVILSEKAEENIADSEQSSHTPGGRRQTSGNIEQKETDSPSHNTTSHHKHLYKFQNPNSSKSRKNFDKEKSL